MSIMSIDWRKLGAKNLYFDVRWVKYIKYIGAISLVLTE